MVNYWLAKQEPSEPRGNNFANKRKQFGMEFIIILVICKACSKKNLERN